MTDAIVETGWLAEHLADPEVILFDATYYLPAEQRDARAEYTSLHIPGAAFFDIDLFADPETDLPHMVPTPGRFARLAGTAGIASTSMVVFYDQKGIFSAARGWWLMRLFGHDRTAVLDGGLPKWLAEGRPTDAGAPPHRDPQPFVATYRGGLVRGIGDMLANVCSGEELVLDARAAPRFNAAVPEPRPGLAAGHIPGAKNIPFGELLTAAQTLRSPDELRARFTAAGVDATSRVVTSCGSGVTATVLTLALARAGLPTGAVYDGSWTEWGLRPDTPKSGTPKES